jgi:hypothetical protein
MPADTFSSFIGMTLQATGNNNNAWGTILNGSALVTLERAIRGNIVRAVTGGTLDLSGSPPPTAVAKALDFIQIFQGTLTANQIVIVPNISGYWKFVNETTGAFQLLLQTPSGAFINIPQGCSRGVTCDGAGNLLRDDRDQVGNFEYNAVANAGTVIANGASLLNTDYPDLYAKYGTTFGSVDGSHFTLPLLTDTGRFLRSSTGSVARRSPEPRPPTAFLIRTPAAAPPQAKMRHMPMPIMVQRDLLLFKQAVASLLQIHQQP